MPSAYSYFIQPVSHGATIFFSGLLLLLLLRVEKPRLYQQIIFADAIVNRYVGPGTKYTLDGEVVTIEVPTDYYTDDEWLLAKALVARFLVSFVG